MFHTQSPKFEYLISKEEGTSSVSAQVLNLPYSQTGLLAVVEYEHASVLSLHRQSRQHILCAFQYPNDHYSKWDDCEGI